MENRQAGPHSRHPQGTWLVHYRGAGAQRWYLASALWWAAGGLVGLCYLWKLLEGRPGSRARCLLECELQGLGLWAPLLPRTPLLSALLQSVCGYVPASEDHASAQNPCH